MLHTIVWREHVEFELVGNEQSVLRMAAYLENAKFNFTVSAHGSFLSQQQMGCNGFKYWKYPPGESKTSLNDLRG